MFITLCWDVLHSSHQICMEKIKLTSVKFKFSKTSQQESNLSAINAISDRLFLFARSSSPPPSLLICHVVKCPQAVPLPHPAGSIYHVDARFGFYFDFSSLRKTRLPIPICLIAYVIISPRSAIVCYKVVFSVVTQRTSLCGEERCVRTLKTAV